MGSVDQEANSFSPGMVVAGRFRIDSQLGCGAMADVFRVHDLAGGRAMALKLLRAEVADDSEAMQRLRREGEVLAQLQHPAVVGMETFGALDDGRIFLVMELLEGETLGARVRRGTMTADELAPIVAATTGGLTAAHEQGVVHRDLKPDNIFLADDPDSETPRVKILDFGISKVYGSEKLTRTGQILGTPRYMAPEQLTAERDLDARVDVYALGVILYEALTGQPPFTGTTPTDLIIAILHGEVAPLRSVRPGIAPELESVVMRAMTRARDARYESAAELGMAWLEATARSGEAAGAAASDAGPQARSGQRTNVLGSMEPPAPEGGSGGSPDAANGDARALRPGTFSAFGSVSAVDPPAADADSAAGEAVHGGSPGLPGAGAQPAASVAADDTPLRVPVRTPLGLWILGALVAGALTATAALAAWHWWSERDAAEGAAAPPSGAAEGETSSGIERSSDPTAATGAVRGGSDAGSAAVSDASAALPVRRVDDSGEAPADRSTGAFSAPAAKRAAERASGAPSPSPSGGPRRSATRSHPSRRSGVSSSARGGEAGPEEADRAVPSQGRAEGAGALLRRARAALVAGEPERCLGLVERAMDAGAPASALRLEGDCLRAAGRRAQARRAYERFCRLVPEHPALSEVRQRVEELGGRCR